MREELAALMHEIWAGWRRYVVRKSILNSNGTMTIPVWAVERWDRQANTPYGELPEKEKDSDRREADKVLAWIEEWEEWQDVSRGGLEPMVAEVAYDEEML